MTPRSSLKVPAMLAWACLAGCEVPNPAYDGVYDFTGGSEVDAEPMPLGGAGGSDFDVTDAMAAQGGGAGMPRDAAPDQRRDTADVTTVLPDAGVPDDIMIKTDKTIVMVGAGFLIMTSKDLGVSWTAMRGGPIGDSTTSYLGAGYAGGKFFAMGWQVATSPDGLAWRPSTLPLRQYFNSVAYGDGTYMMSGGYGTILTSTTGDTWPGNRSHPLGDTTKCHSVAFGGGLFAVSNDKLIVYVTADKGLTWKVSPLKAKFIDYCDGAFRSALDCKTKSTLENLPKFGMSAFWDMRFGDGLYKSPDRMTWQPVYKFAADVVPIDLTFGP